MMPRDSNGFTFRVPISEKCLGNCERVRAQAVWPPKKWQSWRCWDLRQFLGAFLCQAEVPLQRVSMRMTCVRATNAEIWIRQSSTFLRGFAAHKLPVSPSTTGGKRKIRRNAQTCLFLMNSYGRDSACVVWLTFTNEVWMYSSNIYIRIFTNNFIFLLFTPY